MFSACCRTRLTRSERPIASSSWCPFRRLPWCCAPTPQTILDRIARRATIPNVYQGLDAEALRRTVACCLDLADLAAEALQARGVPVLVLDTRNDLAQSAAGLEEFIAAHPPGGNPSDDLRARLLDASGSFRKKEGRHELRTKNVMYCAFSTPNFTVAPAEAQRDAGKRVAHFGLTAHNVAGKSVLDLGSNTGAMLLQLSNFAPKSGLGIEYDQDKVDLSNEIAAHARISTVRFEQGDLDKLHAAQVGVHDVVLALAIEGHVNHPERLYRFLGEVTGELLCFEGNSNCDMEAARRHLKAAGFTRLVDLGFCDDDRDPRNNRRPQLLARKARRRSLQSLLRSSIPWPGPRVPQSPQGTTRRAAAGRPSGTGSAEDGAYEAAHTTDRRPRSRDEGIG